MLRIIAGIILGYVAMAALVVATFFITVTAMGGFEGILQPGTYWTTNTFNIIVLINGTIAAIIGGAVCMLIARDTTAVYALLGIVLAFLIGTAIATMNKPDPPVRSGEVTLEDLNTHGKEPVWYAFTKIGLTAIGVLIGSGLVSRKCAAP